MVEDWTDHPGYLAFHDWILDNVDYLGMEASEAIVEGLARKGMPPPSIAAMSALAKWASTAADNVEDLRADPDLLEELQEYTESWDLDRIDPGFDPSGSVYDHPIYRALRLPVTPPEIERIVEGQDDLEILQHPAESWSLDDSAASEFLKPGDTGVILQQEGIAPGTLIWNFTNPVLGYTAFRSAFRSEWEVILESQCDRCTFEEIALIAFEIAEGDEGVDALQSIQIGLTDRGYRATRRRERGEGYNHGYLWLDHDYRTFRMSYGRWL